MPIYIDHSYDVFHFFWGGAGDDHIIGNGTAGARLVGRGGDDLVTPGIVDPNGPRAIVYGDWLIPGPGIPDHLTKPGGVGGNDWLALGYNVEAVGGAGADVYDVHGPAPDQAQHRAGIRALNPDEGDRVLMDHSNGYMVHRAKGTVLDAHHVELDSLQIRSWSHNPIIHEQNLRVGFADGVVVEFDGPTWQDDVKAWVETEGWLL